MRQNNWHISTKRMSQKQDGSDSSIGAMASLLSLGLFLSLTLFSSMSHASKKHTLDDLISIAVNSNPEILAARDQVKAVSGQLSAARAIPNPEFEGVRGQQRLRSQSGTPGPTSSW
jgi:cobalt-zinc-cadmium efflux system outer membrane protein